VYGIAGIFLAEYLNIRQSAFWTSTRQRYDIPSAKTRENRFLCS